MRVLGVDFGLRRIGLALSDPTGTLARPWKTVSAGPTPEESAAAIAAIVAGLRHEEDSGELPLIVVGVPRRLSGEETEQTRAARSFARALHKATGVRVETQDERLTSHEADRLLAEREKDWRRRKARLDAAAAAVILQDYLDHRTETSGPRPDQGPEW